MAVRPFSRHIRGDFTPAACVRCRNDTDLIDLGADDVDYYGRVYLCAMCTGDLITLLGFTDGTALTRQLEAVSLERDTYRSEFQELQAADLTPQIKRLERLSRDLVATSDNLLHVADAARHRTAGVPVSDGAPAVEGRRGGSEGVPGDGDGDRDQAVGAGGGAGGADRGGQPEPVREGDAGGAGSAAADSAGDGPEFDEGFGWLGESAGESADDALDSAEDAGD